MMKYFDFHTHILFKQIFDDIPNIAARIAGSEISFVPQFCTDLPNIIKSQIHQSQLAEYNDEVIAGVVLYGLESYLATEVLPLREHLKPGSRHKLSEQLLKDVASNTYTAFTDFTVDRTLGSYLNAPETFNILEKESFNNPLPKNKINIFFVVEGCHSLVDTHNKYVPPNEEFPVQEILSNLSKLLEKVNVLSVNPTHLQQSNLCNHAFGMQLTNVKPFIPNGSGMENDGRLVVQGIFDKNICVDVKHMSYKARLDLMTEIDNWQYTNVQPLLCTHAGFTGIPFSSWPGYIAVKQPLHGAVYLETVKSMQVRNNPQRPGAAAFNISTINLFDEEIVWIVKNKGIIGLSLDRRIIGYVDKLDEKPMGKNPVSDLIVDKEFFSAQEWNDLNIPDSKIGKKIIGDDFLTMPELEESTIDNVFSSIYFYTHILLHLKHYFQVCYKAGIPVTTAQKHITFGTDFDGLINPFLTIDSVESMAGVKNYILSRFGNYIKGLKDSKKWAKDLNVPAFVEDLFYNNGYNFVKSRFK